MAVAYKVLPGAKPCRKVPGCDGRIVFRKTPRGSSVCLEEMDWDRDPASVEPGIEFYYLDEDGLAHRTTSPWLLEVPIFICHTSRPGHQHLSRNGGAVDLQAYYGSEAWRRRAAKAKDDVGYTCEAGCGYVGFDVQAHHNSYDRLGREWPEDITVLCPDCHAKEPR